MQEWNNTVNQDIKGLFVSKHVYMNGHPIVPFILNRCQSVEDVPFTCDDVNNLYSYPEYIGEYASFDGGSYEELQEEIERLNELVSDEEDKDIPNLEMITVISDEIEELEKLESDPQEIYEWWFVSDFLCRKLEELGHPVIEDYNIWGRCTSGQAILLDYAISKICFDMEILQGQENSWENQYDR